MEIFCAVHHVLLQDAVSIGLELFMREHEAKQSGRPDAQTPRRPLDQSDQLLISDELLINRSSHQTSEHQLIEGSELDAQTSNGSEVWQKVLQAIKGRISPSTIETWFSPVMVEEFDPSLRLLLLRAPNQVVCDWLKNNHAPLLNLVFGEIGLAGYSVEWLVGGGERESSQEAELIAPAPTTLDQKRELLDFYSVICENRLTSEDEAAFLKVSECTPEAIKAGILRSRLSTMKRGERVGRFNYCVKAIWQIHNAGLARHELISLQGEYYERRPQQASLLSRVDSIEEK